MMAGKPAVQDMHGKGAGQSCTRTTTWTELARACDSIAYSPVTLCASQSGAYHAQGRLHCTMGLQTSKHQTLHLFLDVVALVWLFSS